MSVWSVKGSKVIGRKVTELSGARRILSMDVDIAKHCDRHSVEDKDSKLGTNWFLQQGRVADGILWWH